MERFSKTEKELMKCIKEYEGGVSVPDSDVVNKLYKACGEFMDTVNFFHIWKEHSIVDKGYDVSEFRIELNEKVKGIYFLFNDCVLTYIGRSCNIKRRLFAHKLNKEHKFDAYKYLKLSSVTDEELDEIEKMFIRKLKPTENKSFNPIWSKKVS